MAGGAERSPRGGAVALIGFLLAAFSVHLARARQPAEPRVTLPPGKIAELRKARDSANDQLAQTERRLTWSAFAPVVSARLAASLDSAGLPADSLGGAGALVHGRSAYARISLKTGVPEGREADLLRAILESKLPVRWLSGRRWIEKDTARWEIDLALRTGPPPPAAQRPGVAPGPSLPPPVDPNAPPMDLSDAWSGRRDEVLRGVTGWGRLPMPPVGGPPPDPSVVAGLRLERVLYMPSDPDASAAVIDGRLVRGGGRIHGVLVRQVLPDRVLLGEGGEAEIEPSGGD